MTLLQSCRQAVSPNPAYRARASEVNKLALRLRRSDYAFDKLVTDRRPTIECLGTDIGLPVRAVALALDSLATGFARARALDFPANVQPDDFRFAYRDIVRNNAARIFA